MFNTLKKVIGVDIGNDSLKAALLTRSGQRISCQDTFVYSFPPPTEGEEALGEGRQPEIVLEALKNLQTQMGANCKDIALITSERSVQLKFFDKPEMPYETLQTIVNNEIRMFLQNVEGSEGLEFMFHVVGRTVQDNSTTLHLFCVIFPKSFLREKKSLFQKAGFRLAGIYPFASGLWECFQINYRTETEEFTEPYLTTMINFGSLSNQIAVCDQSVLRLGRIFPTGGEELTRGLAKGYVVGGQETILSRDQAEEMKRKLGILSQEELQGYAPDDLEPQVSINLKRGLERVAQKLRLSLDYFKGQMKIPVQKAYVFGGGANLHGLIECLGDLLMVPEIHEMFPFVNVAYDPIDKEAEPPPAEVQSLIVLAVGAGLCGMKSNDQTLNLAAGHQWDIKKWLRKFSTSFGAQIAMGVAAGLILILYGLKFYVFPKQELNTVMQKASAISKQIAELSPFIPKYKEIQDKLETILAKVNFLTGIETKTIFWSKTFLELEKLIPEQTWVLELTGSEEQPSRNQPSNRKSTGIITRAQIRGLTDEKEKIPMFLQRLENSPHFSRAMLDDSRREENKEKKIYFRFFMNAEVNKVGKMKNGQR